jgi:hypothetical protein
VNFVHVSLLAGSALAILPVMLHLLGRREPKRITFPALRFVRETALQAQRGWSIKRWLLLAMRILLILLAALAFASPRVHSAMLASYLSIGLIGIFAMLASAAAFLSIAHRHPRAISIGIGALAIGLWGIVIGWGGLTVARGTAAPTQSGVGPICAAIVIDTSPAMDYRYANVSRMDEAKDTARWLMDRLPADSQIAIVTSVQGQRLHQGRVSANRQLENVKVEGRVADLPGCIRASIDLVRSVKLDRREVYVLTDMSANAWREGPNAGIPGLLDPQRTDPPVLVQVIDFGTVKRENWSISQLKVSQEVVAPGSSVNVSASIVASEDAPATQIAVELLVEQRDARLPIIRNGEMVLPESIVKDRQNLDVVQGGTSIVRFSLHDLAEGPTHAILRMKRPDPLAIDNELAVTIEAIPQGKVLVLGNEDSRGNNLGRLAALIVDPDLKQVDLKTYAQLTSTDFAGYDAILMVDPPALSDSVIAKLISAVEDGRGLMLVMGPAIADSRIWNSSAISKLLPGKVSRQWRRPMTDRSIYFDMQRPNHPLWSVFDHAGPSIPWNRYPVVKYWVLDELDPASTVILRYASSGHPALIEQPRGAGNVLTMTTTMTDVDTPEQPPWNRLFAADDAWPNFGLLYGAMRYLSGSGQSLRNIPVGAPVTMDNPFDRFPQRYDLFTPSGEVVRIQTQSNTLHYPYANELGTYRLRSSQVEKSGIRGFSTHFDEQTINLKRLEADGLDRVLGKDQYFYVRERDALQSSLGQARYGRDLAPFLLCLLALMAIAEQAMSYRFYSSSTMAPR